MSRSYRYSVVRFAADRLRGERLNIGLVIYLDDFVEVRMPRSLDKLHAVSSAVDVGQVREAVERLPAIYSYLVREGVKEDARADALAELAAVELSELGCFAAASTTDYEHQISVLLRRLVEPEPAPFKIRKHFTKLLADVKSAFRSERVLARKGEGIEAHRLVANYKIAEGLPADLLLQNGAMHVVETVDAAHAENTSMRLIYAIAKSALVFEQARMQFGNEGTRAKLVYKASSSLESFLTPSLQAAEHQGAALVNWESRDDRTRFVVELSSLAIPVADLGRAADRNLHASVQPKFRLN